MMPVLTVGLEPTGLSLTPNLMNQGAIMSPMAAATAATVSASGSKPQPNYNNVQMKTSIFYLVSFDNFLKISR